MAKSGVNKKVAKTAYNNVKKDLQELEKYMNQLVKDVEAMNKDYWYGSKTANKWYDNMTNHYCGAKGSLVKFYTGVSSFQSSLHSVFTKATTKGIDF